MNERREMERKTYPPGTEVRVETMRSGVVRVTILLPKPRTSLDERRERRA